MKPVARNRWQAGLSLLELLAALSVFLVLATLLFEGLAFGSRTWAAIVDGAQRRGDVALVQNFLRSRLEQAIPFSVATGTPLEEYPLVGTTTTLTFSAPGPQALGPGQIYRFQVSVEPGYEQAGTLTLRWKPHLRNQAIEQEWKTEVLLSGVEQLAVSYRDTEDPANWVDSWTGRADLPRSVRLVVRRREVEDKAWPRLVVSPMLSAGSDCVFDPVAMGCRS